VDKETKEQFDAAETRMTRLEEDLTRYAQDSNSRMKRIEETLSITGETLGHFAESVTRAIDSSNARLTRVEENLDALIRAITREHGNGHGPQS